LKVSLFITCLADQFFPNVGVATVRLLRRHGCTVDFPRTQTCCGQPAFNSGYVNEARRVAVTLLDAFDDADYVVSPSGSCVGMIHHYYPELFRDDTELLERIRGLIDKTYEFSQFMVNVLGVTDVGGVFPHRVTYHPSCHGSRLLGVKDEPMSLLKSISEIELVPLPHAEDCCGFGGTFAVKMSEMSGAMVEEKADHVMETEASYLVGTDMGCLMNIAGHLKRRGERIKAMHLSELLYTASENGRTSVVKEGQT
jgi:L-lactate dehydrogenase complex protein LldE